MSADTIEVICRICGQPLTLPGLGEQHDTPLGATLLRLAQSSVHAACGDSFRSNKLQQEETRLLELRSQAWGGICPPLFQNTDPTRLRIAKQFPKAFNDALGWAYGSHGLGCFGTTGGGKTRCIYLVLHRQFLAGKSVVAMTHTEFSGHATRLAMSDRKGERERWLSLLKRVDILFVDDLGKSRFTTADGGAKHGEEVLWDVCEYRWQHLLPFFFTCNFSDGDALAASMSEDKGQPFVRRLREFCNIIPF